MEFIHAVDLALFVSILLFIGIVILIDSLRKKKARRPDPIARDLEELHHTRMLMAEESRRTRLDSYRGIVARVNAEKGTCPNCRGPVIPKHRTTPDRHTPPENPHTRCASCGTYLPLVQIPDGKYRLKTEVDR